MWDIVDTYENIQILGNRKPTHVRGGKLDYAIMFNMNEVQAVLDILYELMSDHFPIIVTLGVDKVCSPATRTRYKLKDGQHVEFISKVRDWYTDYKQTVHDVDKFCKDLLRVIDGILRKTKSRQTHSSERFKSAYFTDKQVKG